ncbi:MAG TPA: acyl carrier protein [Candidatus Eisenbergiella merdipullorum]|uniref:Acyl carrier protein n=1 Tax=Candidatus Eisenbergiella merdipullorum TaxID=2838553 RepID=A0A9D2L0W7_9FIRM|nr:acyl carrier protein [Candidatus Eisenbergiella merdipullorum]
MELDKLRRIIAEVLCVDTKEITEDTTFVDDLCADSLDLYQIVMGIEEEFSIEISPEDAEKIRTVGQALKLIQRSMGNGK